MTTEKFLYFQIDSNGTVLEQNIPTPQKLDIVNSAILDAKSTGIKMAMEQILHYHIQELEKECNNCCAKYSKERMQDLYKNLYELLDSLRGEWKS